MSGALTLRFSTQAQMDIRRMTRELSDLQRQVASGVRANDLSGLGDGASRLLNAQSLRANADARGSALGQLEARFGVQASALSQVSASTTNLAQSIREAVSSNDGRGVGVELSIAFSGIVSGLNETWNGQPLFAGERTSGLPVLATSLGDLVAATTPDQLYDEAARPQTIDLGSGPPIALANKASELSQPLFETLRQLKILVDTAGGELPAPLTGAQRDQLQLLAAQLDSAATTFTNAEGRAGQLEHRFSGERTRLQARSSLLAKEIGDQADADLAMVSVKISSLLVQYEASAKTFSDLSKLSLIDYL
jgi:flagellar hook-associated protein 3 FlgL